MRATCLTFELDCPVVLTCGTQDLSESDVKPTSAAVRDVLEACVLAGGPGGALWQGAEVLKEMKMHGIAPTGAFRMS